MWAARDVLTICEDLRERSEGTFDIGFASDPRVAPREGLGPIDPSGMVKGWALERAADRLRARGIVDFAINAGGDVVTSGCPRPGEKWRVGIQHPWERDKMAAVVAVNDLGVATSGRYERGDHVIDPRTGIASGDARVRQDQWMRGRRVSLGVVVWIVVGMLVAANHRFLQRLDSLSRILSAILAVAVWPLVLFRVHFGV